jgi:hypothetical protein
MGAEGINKNLKSNHRIDQTGSPDLRPRTSFRSGINLKKHKTIEKAHENPRKPTNQTNIDRKNMQPGCQCTPEREVDTVSERCPWNGVP